MGGLLLIQVPNRDSLLLRLAGASHHANNGIIHVNHFNRQSLLAVVEPAGFEEIHTETILTEWSELALYSEKQIDEQLRELGASCTASKSP